MQASRNPREASGGISGAEPSNSSKLLFEFVVSSDPANDAPCRDSNGAEIRRGDLLAFDRPSKLKNFDNYGMYIGKCAVIHVTVDGNNNGWIHTNTLDEIRDKSKFVVANHDNMAKNKYKGGPRNFSDITAAVKPRVGQKVKYDVVTDNCEHYCTLWRYGVAFSTQVQEGIAVAAVPAVGVSAVLSLGISASLQR